MQISYEYLNKFLILIEKFKDINLDINKDIDFITINNLKLSAT